MCRGAGLAAALTAAILVLPALAAGQVPDHAIARSAHRNNCLVVTTAEVAGLVPRSADFAEISCPSERVFPAFRYDRVSRCTRVASDLAPGDIVHVYPEYGRKGVYPGDSLTLAVAIGAVRVEQSVTALQAATSGKMLFVRKADGTILSIYYVGGTP